MVAHLLFQRGYSDAEAITGILGGSPIQHDPLLMPDMREAAERIGRAAAGQESVAVYGDFDADGLTASAIMLETLRRRGVDPIVIIPSRDEGHGLSVERVRELASRGVTLLITADCGIGDIEQIGVARAAGMDVIVTDHHEPEASGVLPDALVVSPTRLDSRYPFRGLSGAGVAYKVSQAVLRTRDEYEQLLDLAAFGTIADVVPLRDENRSIVISGLKRLRATERCGLRALFKVAKIDSRYLDSASVGYYLGPRINAANRLADPRVAFDLFIASDPAEADRIALELNDHNSTRQEKVKSALADAVQQLGSPSMTKELIRAGDRVPLVSVMGDWGPGISGLLASELADRYCVPAFVASAREDGTIAASARSVPGVNVLELQNIARASYPELFLAGGGHSFACGFTTDPDSIGPAFAALGEAARGRVPLEALEPVVDVDAQISLRQVDMRSLELVESLGPYGKDFSEPLFLTRGVTLAARRRMGDNGQHLKMLAKSRNTRVSAISFSCDPELLELSEDCRVDIIFHIQRDYYDGLVRPQLQIKDWRPSD